MSKHKVGDLLYGPTTGLGMIIRIDSEGSSSAYPYVVEWYDDQDTLLPTYHYHQEIEYYKKCLSEQQ